MRSSAWNHGTVAPKLRLAGADSGNVLVAVLVGMTVLALVSASISRSFANGLVESSLVARRTIGEALETYVNSGIDCPNTRASAVGCTAGDEVVLHSTVGALATGVGHYELRARCTTEADVYRVEFRRRNGAWSRLYAEDMDCVP